VRAIFALYLEHQALLPVVQELNRRGWTTKRWVNKAGRQRGGRPFDRTNLHRLLTNIVYLGKVRYKDEVHAGEQPALVDAATWEEVQALLRGNGRNGGGPRRSTRGFLLQGLLRCAACACAMTPSHTRRGCRRYRYYVCTRAQKRGWDLCPSRSIPAGQIEAFVVEQIGAIARDPALFDQAVTGDDEKAERRTALASFASVWPTLQPQDQARVLDLVVQRVAYDGGKETVAITFHPTGLEALAGERAAQTKEKTA
jgi:site-specific DNA recombinase